MTDLKTKELPPVSSSMTATMGEVAEAALKLARSDDVTDPEERAIRVRGAAYAAIAAGRAADGIALLIDEAFRLSKSGSSITAIELFKLARSLIEPAYGSAAVTRVQRNANEKLTAEQDAFENDVLALGDKDPVRRVIVLSDSLGLPRDVEGHDGSTVEETYSAIISRALSERDGAASVRSICQRYFTVEHVADTLSRIKSEIKDADVLIHVGLNDCAARVFLERERYALNLLPEEIRAKMLNFVRLYRTQIIKDNPEYTYVSIENFRAGLEKSVKISKTSGAKQVALATIIQPPLNYETRTPYLRWNFTRYNLAIYETAKKLGATVIDVDRLVWDCGVKTTLVSDGMHLARDGHKLLAQAFVDSCR